MRGYCNNDGLKSDGPTEISSFIGATRTCCTYLSTVITVDGGERNGLPGGGLEWTVVVFNLRILEIILAQLPICARLTPLLSYVRRRPHTAAV